MSRKKKSRRTSKRKIKRSSRVAGDLFMVLLSDIR